VSFCVGAITQVDSSSPPLSPDMFCPLVVLRLFILRLFQRHHPNTNFNSFHVTYAKKPIPLPKERPSVVAVFVWGVSVDLCVADFEFGGGGSRLLENCVKFHHGEI
jgi:hypothetical protein